MTREVVRGIMAVVSQTRGNANITWCGYAGSQRWLLGNPYHEKHRPPVKLPFPHHVIGWLAELGTAGYSMNNRETHHTRCRSVNDDVEWEITQKKISLTEIASQMSMAILHE